MFEFITTSFSNIIYVFFAFSLVIFIHEFGHFYIGKRCGIGVNEFSIGFGPKLFWYRDSTGVLWKFCLLPFGGFVKFEGDLEGKINAELKNGQSRALDLKRNMESVEGNESLAEIQKTSSILEPVFILGLKQVINEITSGKLKIK